MSEAVRVAVGACRCPGTPHGEDYVLLEPRLTVPLAAAAMGAIRTSDATQPAVEGAIAGVFVSPFAIREWSFTNAEGEPIAITIANVAELLPWTEGGMEVAERADALYSADLFAPLVRRLSKPSNSGPTPDSTSPIPFSSRKRQKRSKRSSLTPTAGKPSEDPAS